MADEPQQPEQSLTAFWPDGRPRALFRITAGGDAMATVYGDSGNPIVDLVVNADSLLVGLLDDQQRYRATMSFDERQLPVVTLRDEFSRPAALVTLPADEPIQGGAR